MEYRIIENAESTVAQINGAAESIASGALRQAIAINEMSANMNVMANMMVVNHKNAQLTLQIADEVSKMANSASCNTAEITNKMNQIQMLVEEIVAAKNEMSNGIRQVNVDICTLEKDVQSNAVTSMELQKSSNTLKELINELDKTSVQP